MKENAGMEFERPCKTTSHRMAEDLQLLSRRGIRDLFLFLLVSTIFFLGRGVDLLAPLSDGLRLAMGSPPPPTLTTVAMLAYTVSAGVLIVARLVSGSRPSLNWSHLFFRTVFYPFYLFSNALAENFMGAFVAGLVLIALEHLNIWTYSLRTVPGETGLLGKL